MRLPPSRLICHHDERFFVQQAINFLYETFGFFEAVPRLGLLKNSISS